MTAPRLGDRSLFPTLEPTAYLNHAGVSPPSQRVLEAAWTVLDDFARKGGGAVAAALERRASLRALLASLIGARPEDVAFTQNTSAGVQAVALCFPWRAGDRVVLFHGEFPANVTPWQRAAEAFGLAISFVPLEPFLRSEEEGLALVDRELERGARLLAVSAVQFRSGLRMPLEELSRRCARAGARLFVDAVQCAGAVPLDVRGVDYLAAGAHKWLMGILGAGFLYVRPGLSAEFVPRTAGWLSHEDAARFLVEPGQLRYDRPIRRSASFVEGGGASEVSLAALRASVEILLELGVPAIHSHVGHYLDRLEPELLERGFRSLRAKEPARRSSILSLEPPPGVDRVRLAREVQGRGVACALPDGVLRFSPHWPNDVGEIPLVLEAVDGALASVRER
ncbi:MAG TPA: aminotransferase class V-fold PLP-dependent enzyme [Anaeromyxobacteraceae bacterium]|nr:aminotransferase class V-fold PLP-dependent enzyme [Anaeromyxobacteraceae bacterium]